MTDTPEDLEKILRQFHSGEPVTRHQGIDAFVQLLWGLEEKYIFTGGAVCFLKAHPSFLARATDLYCSDHKKDIHDGAVALQGIWEAIAYDEEQLDTSRIEARAIALIEGDDPETIIESVDVLDKSLERFEGPRFDRFLQRPELPRLLERAAELYVDSSSPDIQEAAQTLLVCCEHPQRATIAHVGGVFPAALARFSSPHLEKRVRALELLETFIEDEGVMGNLSENPRMLRAALQHYVNTPEARALRNGVSLLISLAKNGHASDIAHYSDVVVKTARDLGHELDNVGYGAYELLETLFENGAGSIVETKMPGILERMKFYEENIYADWAPVEPPKPNKAGPSADLDPRPL